MEWITSPEAWVALTTLTLLEIVLGVDNIIFISILVGRLPEAQRQRARLLGLGFAMGTRILLLLLLTWIMRLQATLFSVLDVAISGRDLILIGGGLFLLAKATLEIHHSLEGAEGEGHAARHAGFVSTIIQIGLIDIVFSLDSVITAVGLADHLGVMIIAIVAAVGVMMFAAGVIGRFVDDHPTIKMLALSFLVLIGVALIAEGVDVHIPKGYVYFAMAFSVSVEMLNIRIRGARKPVHLKKKSSFRPATAAFGGDMTGEELAYLAARVLTCGIWVAAGLHKATHYRANIAEMGHLGVPSRSLVLPLVLVLEMVGALLLVVDEYVWAVCLAWLIFLVPASWLYHFKFMIKNGAIVFPQFVTGWKNVSIAGGLLALILLDASRPAWLFPAG